MVRAGRIGSGIEGDTPRARIQGVVSLVPAGEKFLSGKQVLPSLFSEAEA